MPYNVVTVMNCVLCLHTIHTLLSGVVYSTYFEASSHEGIGLRREDNKGMDHSQEWHISDNNKMEWALMAYSARLPSASRYHKRHASRGGMGHQCQFHITILLILQHSPLHDGR